MIRDMPLEERPRERGIREGIDRLSNIELLSIILGSGTKNKSVYDLSSEILSLGNLKDLSYNKLLNIRGIGSAKAIEIISIIELSKRINFSTNTSNIKIHSSIDVFNYYRYLFIDKNQEYFYCLYLDNKNRVIDKKMLFKGTINKSIVHPREVFKYAYACSSSGIICLHNHPSNDVTPSKEDIRLTNSLIEIGIIQGIPILDHIIIGKDNYYSFNDSKVN